MTARLEPSGHNRDRIEGYFRIDRNIAASDRGRAGATSDLTPHEPIAAEHCDGVFICLFRIEQITVTHINSETVVAVCAPEGSMFIACRYVTYARSVGVQC